MYKNVAEHKLQERTKSLETNHGEKQSLSTMLLAKNLRQTEQGTQTPSLCQAQKQLKIDHVPKYQMKAMKLLQVNINGTF